MYIYNFFRVFKMNMNILPLESFNKGTFSTSKKGKENKSITFISPFQSFYRVSVVSNFVSKSDVA